ncbi:MAG TPA: hypothetical protein PKK06_10025 [Phycisphaerae bacterium]|nr:hypothetical protein [Phycisphaerae bacterium]HNU45637.1 hypothetical protein [Phycisphaerae bacterium]
MLGFGREKRRLIQLAERLPGAAFLVALSLDKALMDVAANERIQYHPMRPERLLCFTMGGIGMAVLTGADVMRQVGVRRFGKALDQGRAGMQAAELIPQCRELLNKDVFEYVLQDIMVWFATGEKHGNTDAAEGVGIWIWENLKREEPQELVAHFLTCGRAIRAALAPYWLTPEQIRSMGTE